MSRATNVCISSLAFALMVSGCNIRATPAVAAEPAIGAHGLGLPATFRGDLPCADCEAIRHHLDLWPDQVFHLRREWVGKDFVRDEVGRWRVDSARNAIVLEGGGEMPLQFAILDATRLRALDTQGRPIESALPYSLVSDSVLTPTDVTLPLGGEMRYMADAARFTECRTGRGYPIAMEGDFIKLQTAYRESAPEPGAPLYVTFEGSLTDRPKMDGGGTERTIVVRRFIGAWPGQRCERARAQASLANTYWRIVRIGGDAVRVEPGRREPHLLLHAEGKARTYRATVGCNAVTGSYTADDETIRFGAAAATLLPCPPPLAALEKRLIQALTKARRARITAQTLELIDEAGRPVALFEAVYL